MGDSATLVVDTAGVSASVVGAESVGTVGAVAGAVETAGAPDGNSLEEPHDVTNRPTTATLEASQRIPNHLHLELPPEVPTGHEAIGPTAASDADD